MDIAHSVTSTAETYHCQICGKTFGKRSVLTMHMSVHQTSDQNSERFHVMERRSLRNNKARTTAAISSISSPLKNTEVQTDTTSAYRTRSREKASLKAVESRPAAGSNVSVRTRSSSSRENALQTKKNNVANYRTRSTSKANDVTNNNNVSTSPQKATSPKSNLKSPVTTKRVHQQDKSDDVSCDVTSDNNSELQLTSDDVKPSSQRHSDVKCNQPASGIDSNTSHDSDKENSDVTLSQSKDALDFPDSVLQQFLLPGVDVATSPAAADATSPIAVDNSLTKADVVLDTDSVSNTVVVSTTNDSSSTITSENQTKSVSVVAAPKNIVNKTDLSTVAKATTSANTATSGGTSNAIHVTSSNDVKYQPSTTDKKNNNTQTIVIVIREAKPVRRRSAEDVDSRNNNSIKLTTSSSSGMALTQSQLMTSAHHQFYTKPMQLAPAPAAAGPGAPTGGVSAKTSGVAMPQVLAPHTGVLSRSDVPRTVASVAPSFVSNAPRMMTFKNGTFMDGSVVQQQQQQKLTTSLNNNSIESIGVTSGGDGDTTDTDDGGNDDMPPTRKSARLDGKVPAWKQMMQKDGNVYAALEDARKRKIGRPRLTTTETEADMEELSGTAEELLGNVVSEVELDDEELADMSNQLFATRRHQRMYRDEHTCDVCGKSFSSEKYLQMHSSLHGAATPHRHLVAENFKTNEYRGELGGDGFKSSSWTCKICNKIFAQNSSFKNHMRTHSDERPFVCEICSIGFKERYHLKKHMLFKHSDELKEKCQFCGKRFKDSTAVRAHERIHSDHRPYHCRRCGKAFKTSECLWHHENRSKTCGALGGPPLPPLPKKARAARKQKSSPPTTTLQQLHSAPVQVLQSQRSAPIIKSEQENMLELVNQIIQSDNRQQQQLLQNAVSQHQQRQHQQQLQNSLTLTNINHGQLRMVPVTTTPAAAVSVAATTAQQQQLQQTSQLLTAAANAGANQQQQLQSQTVKLPQGQQLVLSLPPIKEGNDATAQVTKAILDAISNTTGQMKGVNLQKAIQCAVNNVQEVIDVGKGHEAAAAVAQLQNATAAQHLQPAAQQMLPRPVMTSSAVSSAAAAHLPAAVPAQGLHSDASAQLAANHVVMTSSSVQQPMTSYDVTMQQQLQLQQSVQCQLPNSKPYTVSILPPISSVAQAMRANGAAPAPLSAPGGHVTAGAIAADSDDEDYSSSDADSEDADVEEDDDDDVAMANDVNTSGIPTGNDGVTAANQLNAARPVATVQPLRRVESSRSSSTDSDTSSQGVVMMTSHAQQNARQLATAGAVVKQSNYKCAKCGKGFAVQSAYDKHLLKHTEVRPFRCQQCDIGFKLKVHLKKHNLYRHSDEYPCACSVCGKRFKDSSAVRLHEKIHSEQRPFCCGCGKSFKTRENLWGHQNRKMCPYAACQTTMKDEIIVQQDGVYATADYSGGALTSLPASYSQAYVSTQMSGSQSSGGFTSLATRPTSIAIKEEPMTSLVTTGGNQLPSIDSFSHAYVSTSMTTSATSNDVIQAFIKKESIAEQCPTIQNLLKSGPRAVTKLPGIQQLFKSHSSGSRPPPPYPGGGHMTPPPGGQHYSSSNGMSPAYSYQSSSASPVPSPLPPSVPASPARSPARSPAYHRQNSHSPITSPCPSGVSMLSVEQLYSSALRQDPSLWGSARKHSELASPSTELCPITVGGGGATPKSPRSPRGGGVGGAGSMAMSPAASSHCSEAAGLSQLLWDDDCERKPVLTQWQNTDSDTLFMELSTNMLSQI